MMRDGMDVIVATIYESTVNVVIVDAIVVATKMDALMSHTQSPHWPLREHDTYFLVQIFLIGPSFSSIDPFFMKLHTTLLDGSDHFRWRLLKWLGQFKQSYPTIIIPFILKCMTPLEPFIPKSSSISSQPTLNHFSQSFHPFSLN